MTDPTSPFCLASTDEDFTTLAECTRRNGHNGHHCDTRKHLSWDGHGPVDCGAGHDHGSPPNRAARRGNVTHPQRSELIGLHTGRKGR